MLISASVGVPRDILDMHKGSQVGGARYSKRAHFAVGAAEANPERSRQYFGGARETRRRPLEKLQVFLARDSHDSVHR
jgi:hypothetical protein